MAVCLELPLLIVDIQRGGPSTGLPTKTEQSDLLHAMYGRHGEAPVPIVAAMTPSHCFEAAIEAVRIAVTYRTPVFLLSDGYLANGSEPWRLPDVADLPDIAVAFATETNHTDEDGTTSFWPYIRDERPWPGPGPSPAPRASSTASAASRRRTAPATSPTTPRTTSGWSTSAAAKVAGIAKDIPPARGRRPRRVGGARSSSSAGDRPTGPSPPASGGCGPAAWRWPTSNSSTSTPSPPISATSSRAYDQVLVPEANLGQLSRLVRAEYLVDATLLSKVQGSPFRAAEIELADPRAPRCRQPPPRRGDEDVAS